MASTKADDSTTTVLIRNLHAHRSPTPSGRTSAGFARCVPRGQCPGRSSNPSRRSRLEPFAPGGCAARRSSRHDSSASMKWKSTQGRTAAATGRFPLRQQSTARGPRGDIADQDVRHACGMQACRTSSKAHALASSAASSAPSCSDSASSSAKAAAPITSATMRVSLSATAALLTRVNSAVPRARSGPTA